VPSTRKSTAGRRLLPPATRTLWTTLSALPACAGFRTTNNQDSIPRVTLSITYSHAFDIVGNLFIVLIGFISSGNTSGKPFQLSVGTIVSVGTGVQPSDRCLEDFRNASSPSPDPILPFGMTPSSFTLDRLVSGFPEIRDPLAAVYTGQSRFDYSRNGCYTFQGVGCTPPLP